MANKTFVEVTGPRDVAELAGRVRDILDLPEGEMHGEDDWDSQAVSVERASEAWEYDYLVMLRTGERADGQGREVFDRLAASTGWALCLLDAQAVPVDQRPAVSRAS